MLPLLLAAANSLPVGSPVPVGGYVPYNPPAGSPQAAETYLLGTLSPVETFDPAARASALAQTMPRNWSGTYQPFDGGASVPVALNLASITAFGQMVDVRGEMTVGSVVTPVQGNLNAKSDQLDLLVLCQCDVAGLELGAPSWACRPSTSAAGWRRVSPIPAASWCSTRRRRSSRRRPPSEPSGDSRPLVRLQ